MSKKKKEEEEVGVEEDFFESRNNIINKYTLRRDFFLLLRRDFFLLQNFPSYILKLSLDFKLNSLVKGIYYHSVVCLKISPSVFHLILLLSAK